MDKIREYAGQDIVVTYDPGRCIHVAECVRGLPGVFERGRRPWVQADAAPADEIAAVILRCPTGALHFARRDGGADELAPATNTIEVSASGPLYVRGDVEIRTPDGAVIVHDTRLALCRCGVSKNKPFCDLSHEAGGFSDPGLLGENRLAVDEAVAAGRLIITPAVNGPCRFVGHVEIRGADGQTVYTGDRGSLCRCGGSRHKPFCDGTHREIGFQTE